LTLSLTIYICLVITCTIGISLIKISRDRRWSLRHRVAIRNKDIKNILKESGVDFFSYLKQLKVISHIILIAKKNRMEKMDREIFEGITFLRNLASIEKGRNTGADYVIQKLSEQQGLLQPAYINMLSLLHLNKKVEALENFYLNIETPFSKDYARLLIQWDEIPPSDLSETLLSYEKSMKEARITNQRRRDEIISELIYFPVVLNVLIIFVNFIYVAYFIQQKEMLQIFM
jgi:hypothetical protein